MNTPYNRTGPLMELSSYPGWAGQLVADCAADRARVTGHVLFQRMRDATLPYPVMRHFLIGVWPVIEQFPQYMAFNLLKYLGAAYLVYLGIRMLVRGQGVDAVTPAAALGSRRALLEGLVVEALNVKTALFFLAFLPQFVAPGPTMAVQLALLGCICVALNTLVDVAAVRGAAQWARPGAARLARARLLQRVSGGTMIGLGAFLALARRGN